MIMQTKKFTFDDRCKNIEYYKCYNDFINNKDITIVANKQIIVNEFMRDYLVMYIKEVAK